MQLKIKKLLILAIPAFLLIAVFLVLQLPSNNNPMIQPSSELQQEKPDISSALSAHYTLLEDWTVSSENLLLFQGEYYYGATLVPSERPNQGYDTYRALLKKTDGSWQVVSQPPQLIFSYADFPDIPAPIIDLVNRLES